MMKLGSEPKKVAVLAGLLVLAAVLLYTNLSGPDYQRRTATAPPPVQPQGQVERGPVVRGGTEVDRRRVPGRNLQEFRPSLKPRKPEDQPDPMTRDPRLRVDLLAKLQTVKVEGTHRNIFEFGQAPEPPKAPAANGKKPAVPSPLVAGKTPEDSKPAEPSKPAPPPIPLKFYGYLDPRGQVAKRAFFLEGDDIHVVTEGEVVKRRYKVVRIGVSSVTVEDITTKSTQTLPLIEEQQPG